MVSAVGAARDVTVEFLPSAAAVVLAALHLFAGPSVFPRRLPRSRWLSVAGGISVAYVVSTWLPEIAEYQESVSEQAPTPARGRLHRCPEIM